MHSGSRRLLGRQPMRGECVTCGSRQLSIGTSTSSSDSHSLSASALSNRLGICGKYSGCALFSSENWALLLPAPTASVPNGQPFEGSGRDGHPVGSTPTESSGSKPSMAAPSTMDLTRRLLYIYPPLGRGCDTVYTSRSETNSPHANATRGACVGVHPSRGLPARCGCGAG